MRINKLRLSLWIEILLAVLIGTGCGEGGGGGGGGGGSGTSPVTLADVAALFPGNGANWNDYVQGTASTATDTACNAAIDTACIHGGERRVVVATGKSSCSGLTASDALGAFDWVCDSTTNPVRLLSTGLASGKYLSDLIDFGASGFKPDKVTVYDNGTAWGVTSSTVWWSNTVAVNNSGGSLATASTVYLVTSNPAASYTLDADKVALVIQPGVTLTGPGTNANVVSSTHYHVWFEGTVDATGDAIGVELNGGRFSALRNVTASNDTNSGIFLANASNNTLSDVTANNNFNGVYLGTASNNNTVSGVTASNNGGSGVYLFSASNNMLSGVTASNNTSNGVYLDTTSNNNMLSSVTASNNGGSGVYLYNASNNNTLSGVKASNNGGSGVYLYIASNNTVSGVTASNNGDSGVYLYIASNNNTLSGVTANNNSWYGVILDNASNNTLSDVTASNNINGVILNVALNNTLSDVTTGNNSIYGFELIGASNSLFTGLLKVGSNTSADCFVNGGTNPGLVNGTCANNGSSDATLTTGITHANVFVGNGKVTSDDTSNASDTNGTAGFPADPAAFDWSHFDNAYRGWGKDGSAFPNADQQGQWTTGTGRIWDWSLSASDAVLRNVLTLPTGNDTLTQVWSGTPSPSNNAGCNALVTGSVWNGSACETTFLRRAVETPDDGIGNDNNLCESGETCLYTPNIGSYQGHGTLASAGTFTGGTLTGITLMKYATNGR